MSREAMKLALEALEICSVRQEHQWNGLQKISIAKEALKEALAKQEQRSVSEQLGEPVALETIYETIIHWDEGGGKRSRRELARRIEALYTTPQQRKPLTHEQVYELWLARFDTNEYDDVFMNFARAIEAAHGIKE